MPRRKYTQLPLDDIIKRLHECTLDDCPSINLSNPNRTSDTPTDILESIDVRIKKIIGITNRKERPNNYMQFFIMYDIESDKVRTLVSKYLQKQGCTRVQNSIFLADLPTEIFKQIQNDLTEVQTCYDNHDSILIVPVSIDHLKAMSVIGKTIDIEVIMKTKSTLFF